jgi:hypothetical protein
VAASGAESGSAVVCRHVLPSRAAASAIRRAPREKNSIRR